MECYKNDETADTTLFQYGIEGDAIKNHPTVIRKSYNQIISVTLLDHMQFCLRATHKNMK